MSVEYPVTIPDLLTRFGLNPLSFGSYQDLLRELQALFDTAGVNPQGGASSIDGRLDALEAKLAAPALSIATADSAAISNTTTETPFTTGTYTVPANSAAVGRTYRVTAGGKLGTMSSTPGTLTLTLRWGVMTSDPLLVSIGPTPGNLAVSMSNEGWAFDALLTVRTVGVSGTIMGIGSAVVPSNGVGTDGGAIVIHNRQTGVATINCTVPKALTLFAKWSVQSLVNTITLQNFVVEQVG